MSEGFLTEFSSMMNGEMSDTEICRCLAKWEDEGIGPDKLRTAAALMRDMMIAVSAPEGAIDIVGTGGDGLHTYNISTAVCFVVAGAGVPVAKHGNRAVSSRSGASDVLTELGVKLDIPPAQTETCIEEAGVGFLFAPNHHKAMKHVAAARALFGRPSIFNRLGPLLNPASVRHYLMGVYSRDLCGLYADVLSGLGAKHALVVNGADGMDEITTTGPTRITELKDGTLSAYTINPEDYGLKQARPEDLQGGDPSENARALLDVLDGAHNAYAEIVSLNAAAALYAADKVESIRDGLELARHSLESGKARQALNTLVEVSNA